MLIEAKRPRWVPWIKKVGPKSGGTIPSQKKSYKMIKEQRGTLLTLPRSHLTT